MIEHKRRTGGRKKRPAPTQPLDALEASIAQYLDWIAVHNFSQDTVNTRRSYLGYFHEWCRERGLEAPIEITRPILERYQRWLYHYRKTNGQPLGFRTQHTRLQSIKSFFQWMARQNIQQPDITRAAHKVPSISSVQTLLPRRRSRTLPASGVQSVTMPKIKETLTWNDRSQIVGLGASTVTTPPAPTPLLTLGFYLCAGQATSCVSGNTGSLLAHTISVPGLGMLSQTFTYDSLNRLSTAGESGVGAIWSQAYNYDTTTLGNRWVSFPVGFTLSSLTPTTSTNYTASSNRLTSPGSYNYDANGNQTTTTNAANPSTFDAEGRMLTNNLNGAVTSYTYDAEGQRVTKQNSTAATTYVYDAFGNLAAEYTVPTVDAPLPSGVVRPCGAIVVNSTTTCYVTVDQLGSTRMVTDSNGNVTSRYDYLPSGEEIPTGLGGRTTGLLYSLTTNTASTETSGTYGDGFNPKFTGQVRDYESGLDYLNARYYSPAQGRFISPDPGNAGGDPTNPQTWNAYAYVGNNPLTVTDPSGLGFWSSIGNFFLNLGLDFISGGLNAIFGGVQIGPSVGSIGGCGGPLGNCGSIGGAPWGEQPPGLGANVQNPGRFVFGLDPVAYSPPSLRDYDNFLAAVSDSFTFGWTKRTRVSRGLAPADENSTAYRLGEWTPSLFGGASLVSGASEAWTTASGTMRVAVGRGALPTSPFHVAYEVGGQWMHANGSSLGKMVYTTRGAKGFAAGASKVIDLRLRDPEAVKRLLGEPLHRVFPVPVMHS